MNTFKANLGTALPHALLSLTVAWLARAAHRHGPIHYVDTHAMAPMSWAEGAKFEMPFKQFLKSA